MILVKENLFSKGTTLASFFDRDVCKIKATTGSPHFWHKAFNNKSSKIQKEALLLY